MCQFFVPFCNGPTFGLSKSTCGLGHKHTILPLKQICNTITSRTTTGADPTNCFNLP